MTLFATIIEALHLQDSYETARKHYNTPEALSSILENLGNIDEGTVLASSMQTPQRFMVVTDAILDYINNHLDTLPQADTILSVLLETESVFAETFEPRLVQTPSSKPGHVDVSFSGVGIALGFFSSESHLDISRETLLDDILDEESQVVYRGKLTVYEDDMIRWSPYAETTTGNLEDATLEIPVSESVEVPIDVEA